VGFALRKGGNVERLVQVSYASCRDGAEKREIDALAKASDGLKRKDMLVVTWGYGDDSALAAEKSGSHPGGDSHSVPEAPTARPAENPLRSISAPCSKKPLRGPTAPYRLVLWAIHVGLGVDGPPGLKGDRRPCVCT